MKHCSKWFLIFIGLIFFMGLQTNALAEAGANGPLKVIVPSIAAELTPTGPCPAEAVLGMDDPRLDTLRAFRDQVLAKNPNGQKTIKMYYDSSAAVVQLLEKDPALRASAKKYLESILPAIELMIKK